ncbi:MAG TPA: NADH-quinone oxidoreductase subunit A [Gammaproteobacteria bacterium]|nr:NADH-quinone oxidoreductase subunit A [Gammaproteobacteria bacterium]
MLVEYLPILVFVVVGVLIGVVPPILSLLIAPRRPDPAKNSAFECGFDPFEETRMPFNVRYYLIAIVFIVFDLETAFLFPWAVYFREMPTLAIVSMVVFLTVLIVGFVYEWRKGALEWD